MCNESKSSQNNAESNNKMSFNSDPSDYDLSLIFILRSLRKFQNLMTLNSYLKKINIQGGAFKILYINVHM